MTALRPPVVVTGFGRCGSTMLMQMLHAGGIPFAPGAAYSSGEHHSTEQAIASARPGHAVKLLDPVGLDWQLPPAAADWTFLWLDRDLVQQSRSWAKFTEFVGIGRPSPLHLHQVREQWKAERAIARATLIPGPITTCRYEDILATPMQSALRIAAALPDGYVVDPAAMAGVVHRRDGACRPDMSVEADLVDAHPGYAS